MSSSDSAIRLYGIDIARVRPRREALLSRVDKERRARVLRLGQTDEALRSLAAGLLLSAVLGRDDPPRRTEYGKPYYDDTPSFSLSHAGDYALLAVSGAGRVGVDVERERTVAIDALAKRFFPPEEQALLAKTPISAQKSLFFTIWTLKESYVKADGRGFSVSPRSYAVLPRDPNGALLSGGDAPYSFFRPTAPDGYFVAVCRGGEPFACKIEPITDF